MSYTTLDSIKAFWPDVVNDFPAAQLDSQLGYYLLRADYLLQRLGTPNNVPNGAQVLELAENMLVRRLIWADRHPAASAEPANVTRENAGGLSYSLDGPRTLAQIIGDEILQYLADVITSPDWTIAIQSTVVFEDATLQGKDINGNPVKIYTPTLSDSYQNWSERWRQGPWQGMRRRGLV